MAKNLGASPELRCKFRYILTLHRGHFWMMEKGLARPDLKLRNPCITGAKACTGASNVNASYVFQHLPASNEDNVTSTHTALIQDLAPPDTASKHFAKSLRVDAITAMHLSKGKLAPEETHARSGHTMESNQKHYVHNTTGVQVKPTLLWTRKLEPDSWS